MAPGNCRITLDDCSVSNVEATIYALNVGPQMTASFCCLIMFSIARNSYAGILQTFFIYDVNYGFV